ncbi:hypothetical protein DICA1_D08812 [Diutina catenulata]
MIRLAGRGVKPGRLAGQVRHVATRFPEGASPQAPTKPSVGQFKYPLFNTFLIAAATCAVLNTVWYKLERDDQERQLSERAALLEHKINEMVEAKKEEVAEKQTKKKSWWKVW